MAYLLLKLFPILMGQLLVFVTICSIINFLSQNFVTQKSHSKNSLQKKKKKSELDIILILQKLKINNRNISST